jgi:predicted dehydrogenase
MSEKVRVAAIGAGYFSQFQYQGWRNIAGADCVALCNRDAAKGQAVASRFGVPRVFGNARDMLVAVKPDLLDIITPPATHMEYVSLAAEFGVPVICQKPYGQSYDEAQRLTEVAERAGILLVVHENFRFMPWYREIRRLLDQGKLGQAHCVTFRLRPGDGQGPRAYLDRQPYFQNMPRFLVVETAIHLIDTFRYLMGEVGAVYAKLRRINPVIAGEDAGYIVFEFNGGPTGLFDGNRLNDHVARNPRRTMGELWLEGSAGILRLDGEARLWWKPHQRDEIEHEYDRGPEDTFGGGACEALQRHVLRHMIDAAPLENSGRDYLANLRVQEAVYRSDATGRRVSMAGFDPLAAHERAAAF